MSRNVVIDNMSVTSHVTTDRLLATEMVPASDDVITEAAPLDFSFKRSTTMPSDRDSVMSSHLPAVVTSLPASSLLLPVPVDALNLKVLPTANSNTSLFTNPTSNALLAGLQAAVTSLQAGSMKSSGGGVVASDVIQAQCRAAYVMMKMREEQLRLQLQQMTSQQQLMTSQQQKQNDSTSPTSTTSPAPHVHTTGGLHQTRATSDVSPSPSNTRRRSCSSIQTQDTDCGGKDESYWQRRRKNNDAAKRSRDARRAKEEQVALRASLLEQENMQLRVEVTAFRAEVQRLSRLVYQNNCLATTNNGDSVPQPADSPAVRDTVDHTSVDECREDGVVDKDAAAAAVVEPC